MADAVTTDVVNGTTRVRRVVVHLTNLSDATGETNVVKVDRSALSRPDGEVPTNLHIASVRWNIQGFTYVKISWDHATDDTAFLLSGNGYDNFEAYGNLRDPNTSVDTVTGAIGDILLSTAGGASGSTYDITLEVVLS